MRSHRLVGAASVILAFSLVARADAGITTDRLSGRQASAWKRIMALAGAVDPDGRPLYPTLHRLWQEVDFSGHVVQIEMPRSHGISGIAGRFLIETVGHDGRFGTVIRLHLEEIDNVSTRRPNREGRSLLTLRKVERYAQVLGHELAHAAWAFADPEHARLAMRLQSNAALLARQARQGAAVGAGFAAELEATDRLARRLEEPAVAAEVAVGEELQAGGRRR
jgi:hypothetical protein